MEKLLHDLSVISFILFGEAALLMVALLVFVTI